MPERREELTTEGGLDVAGQIDRVGEAVASDRRRGHRGLALHRPRPPASRGLHRDGRGRGRAAHGALRRRARGPGLERPSSTPSGGPAPSLVAAGVELHAGHGLNYRNVGPIARIDRMAELNIGHSIVSRAVFVGLTQAVREMKDCICKSLHGPSE